MNERFFVYKSLLAVAVTVTISAGAAFSQSSDLKGFVFGETTIDEWREAVFEEQINLITGKLEVVAPFCASGEQGSLPNRFYFSDQTYNPDLGIESCYDYAPSCTLCFSSLAQAATDRNLWTFMDGTLVKMSATMYRGQLLNNSLGPLTAKYGEPDEISTSTVSNAMGAQFENRQWIWHLNDLEIAIIERIGELDKSLIIFREPELELRMNRRLQQATPDTSNL